MPASQTWFLGDAVGKAERKIFVRAKMNSMLHVNMSAAWESNLGTIKFPVTSLVFALG